MAAPGLTGGLIAIGAVVIVALAARAMGGGKRDEGNAPATPPEPGSPAEGIAEEPAAGLADEESVDADQDGVDDSLVVAVTSDGAALVPDVHEVVLLPAPPEGEEWKVGAGIESATLRAERARFITWSHGDLHGARVVRGGADEAPWHLEMLGRDGEYLTLDFESSEAADAARELFVHQRVVQYGEDEDGRPMPPSAEMFEEARRIYEQTVAALGAPDTEGEFHPSDDEPREDAR